MSKQRLCIYIVAVFVTLLGLAITYISITLLRASPLYPYYNLFPRLHELPTRRIRPIFYNMTEQIELPNKADNLRAIIKSGIDPAFFVRFHTDSEGIEYILKKFSGPTANLKTYDAGLMKALNEANEALFFYYPSRLQEKLGICLFDQDSIESGRLLEGSLGSMRQVWYTIFIEDKNNNVYIFILHI